MSAKAYRSDWNIGRIFTIALLIAAIVLVDQMTATNLTGMIANFIWKSLVVAISIVIRRPDVFLGAVIRTRLMQVLLALFSVNLGYLSRAVLTDVWGQRVSNWRRSLRIHTRKLGKRWKASPILFKIIVAVLLILGQIVLLPRWSEWVILFPVGFVIHAVESLYRRLFGKFANAAIDRVVGDKHHKLIERVGWLERTWRMFGLWRLRLLTGWRLWRYDPQYRNPKTGKRRKSFFEVVRLWRSGKLDRYFGRPLLGGHRDDPAME
ncbi:hypothetical protein FJY93_05320 [Candidatus Kaiserbacteria bacterium]|nr:hypothetical protein [Candidatus Kaiserbacteria bacterium]